MIVDSSAIIAILKRERGWPVLSEALDSANSASISAANYLESSLVVDGWRDPILSREFDEMLARFNIVFEPVTVEQAKMARQAYRDFGKGSGHPANLDFGDCFSYALARDKREPMLWKGEDFGHTGLQAASEGR
jgi:ribonuclease VapC